MWERKNECFLDKCENDISFRTAVWGKIVGITPRRHHRVTSMQGIYGFWCNINNSIVLYNSAFSDY